MNKKLFAIIVFITFLTFFMLDDLVGDWSKIDSSFNLYIFFTEDMFPPDWSILKAED